MKKHPATNTKMQEPKKSRASNARVQEPKKAGNSTTEKAPAPRDEQAP